jgi:RNA polymerase sigma factor (sigma-70 family)
MVECAPGNSSFAASYVQHHRRIYHLCLRYGGGDHGFAEDVTHDTFIRLLQHWPQLEDHDDVGAWLYRVATNLALSQLRRRRWLRWWIEQREPPPMATTDLAPDCAAEQRQAARRALETLSALPARERIVACMRLLDGKSQTEIAETLSLSEGYVSKLLARAWTRIRAAGWDGQDDGTA